MTGWSGSLSYLPRMMRTATGRNPDLRALPEDRVMIQAVQRPLPSLICLEKLKMRSIPGNEGIKFIHGVIVFHPGRGSSRDSRRSQGVRLRSPPAAGAHPMSGMPGIIPHLKAFFSGLPMVHRPILSGGGLREGEHPPPDCRWIVV